MSETEDVPELSPEAKAFLSKHQATGEPSAEALERGRQRMASLGPGTTSRRRPLFSSEVMAAAAVVTLLLGAQGLYLALRAPPVAQPKPEPAATGELEMNAIAAAWTAGELDTAGRLASNHCQSAACRPVATELTRALGLAARLDTLTGPELDELAGFDAKLSGGRPSAIQARVAQRRETLLGSVLRVAAGTSGRVTTDREISRLAIGDSDVADVSVDGPRTIKVKGISAGTTTLLVWFTNGARMTVKVEISEQGPSDQTLSLRVTEPEGEPEVEVPVAVAQPSDSTIPLTIGSITDLKLKGFSRLAVGDPGIADVSVSPAGDIRVKGMSEGRTTLLVWFSNGERQSLMLVVEPTPK